MKTLFRMLLIVAFAAFVIGTVPSCGAGGILQPIATIIKYTYKIIKLFKKPEPIATAKVDTENFIGPDGKPVNGGKTTDSTLEIVNNTQDGILFRVDNASVNLPDQTITAGKSFIWTLPPGTYEVSTPGTDYISEPDPVSGGRDDFIEIVLAAGMAYKQVIIDTSQQIKQTVNKDTGAPAGTATPTGQYENQTPFVPPVSTWGTISVENKADISFPQYLDGTLMFMLAPGEEKTYDLPPGDHIVSNSLDFVNDNNAAYLWFDVKTNETRFIEIHKRD